MLADERVYLLGEDILDPYGGAFKVAQGLSTAFPERVIPAPVSEAGMVGVAAGMALRGLRPVVEIMFGDFITLAADQLINTAAKFRWMYNEQVRVPLVVRTPMGGRRGYGPTHSQTLEKLFAGVPGMRILAPTAVGDPGQLLSRAILETEEPVLFVENKLLYAAPLQSVESLGEFMLRIETIDPDAPVATLEIRGAPAPALTLVAYGYMAELARQAALALAYDHEIFVQLLIPTQLSPWCAEPVLESVARTRRLLVVEEGTRAWGWGAEIVAGAAEAAGGDLLAATRVAAADHPIPAAPALEAAALPGPDEIVRAARGMITSSPS